MDTEDLIEPVARRLKLDPPAAHRATLAVIGALGACLTREQAQELAAGLPAQLTGHLDNGRLPLAHPTRAGFLTRVAELGGTHADRAEVYARAVLGVLRDAASRGELPEAALALPGELEDLLVA